MDRSVAVFSQRKIELTCCKSVCPVPCDNFSVMRDCCELSVLDRTYGGFRIHVGKTWREDAPETWTTLGIYLRPSMEDSSVTPAQAV